MRTRFLLVMVPSICLAASATQTDWSGGDGVPGPVAFWGNGFDSSAAVSWLAQPGELHLSSTPAAPVTHTVAGSFIGAISVHAADVDGDGDMYVLGAAYLANDITWWEVSEFLGSGELTGSILDAGETPDWGQATWTGDVPAGTDLEIELRAGNDPGSMGSWVPMENSGDEIPSGFDGMRYIQYRIMMTKGDNSASPGLEDIAIDWTPFVGIEEEAGSPAFQLFGACPNPTAGGVSIGFSVPAVASVELMVYDLSGRRVAGTEMECAEGSHTFTPGVLAAGVYLVHMRAGEFGATRRFVVTEQPGME